MAAYFAIKAYCIYTTTLFFREIQVINQENLPDEGPVIVYGNHNNQFVDGLLLTAVLKRSVHFVAAAASMRRHIIGPMLVSSGAIPVERPQDLAKKGKGKIVRIYNNKVIGEETDFTTIKLKSIVKVGKQELRVAEIVNDLELITDTPGPKEITEPMEYKIIPKLEFFELYQYVWKALDSNKCIGIFPEGGSHDRLEVLPLKAGICIMALGAMEKYGKPVTIVPVGYNYYNPQNFRSKVIMEFGPGYKIPEELLELYKVNQKRAISLLLDNLVKMLKAVTTEVRTFEELSTLFSCRQLYTLRLQKSLTTKQKLELNRRFSKGFDMLVKEPRLKETLQKLKKFNQFVKLNGLSISSYRKNSVMRDIFSFLFHFQKCAVRLLVALPGILLMYPTTSLIAYQAQKQRIRCLKKSEIKAKANDVVGSYKILLSMIYFPITTSVHTWLCFKALRKFTDWQISKCWKVCALIPLLMPIYALALVKSFDSLGRSFKKLKFLFVRIFKRSIYTEFYQTRKQLSQEILGAVDRYGAEVVEDFDKNRIVKPEEMMPGSSTRMVLEEDDCL